jgi:hypothetical protein
MVNELYANAFCSDDIRNIENYDIAVADTVECWVCHHRKEIQEDRLISSAELQELGLYYHRPASELIFMRRGDHSRLHNCNRPDDLKERLRSSHKGLKRTELTKQRMRDAWARSKEQGTPRGALGMHWHIEKGKRVYTKE